MDCRGMGVERPTRRKVVLYGLFGMGNLGNEATLRAMVYHLRQRQPETEVVCVCGNPGAVAEEYGTATLGFDPLPPRGFVRVPGRMLRGACFALGLLVTEPRRRHLVRRQLEGADQFLVVGTGALDDFGVAPWNVPTWLLRWCSCARRVGASVGFVAVGAGPILNPLNRRLMRRAVLLSNHLSFRDTPSRDYLRRLRVDTRTAPVVPDLVFGLPPQHLPPLRPPASPPRVIGVGLMAYYGWTHDKQAGQRCYEAYLGKMTEFVLWLLRRGYEVRLLTGELRTDDTAVEDLLRRVSSGESRSSAGRVAFQRVATPDDLLREIAKTDAVVVSRYHNVVCSLLLGRPVISLGYAEKFESLMENVGLGPYCQQIEQLSVKMLVEQFGDVVAAHGRLVQLVETRVRAYRQQIDELCDSLFSQRG